MTSVNQNFALKVLKEEGSYNQDTTKIDVKWKSHPITSNKHPNWNPISQQYFVIQHEWPSSLTPLDITLVELFP